MVFIKFDCATRLRVNYLGVNVRYINNEKQAVTKTLMVKDTQSQHTSNELKMMLRKILQEFDIPPSNVLCCVTDNASNMVRTGKAINHSEKFCIIFVQVCSKT